MLIFAVFSIIIGILSLLNPAFLGDSRNLVIGIFLVVEAVLDITVFFLLKHALKKHTEPAEITAEAVPDGETPAASEANNEPAETEPAGNEDNVSGTEAASSDLPDDL